MLSQVSPLRLIFIFFFSPLKTLSFSHRPSNLSQKNHDLRLIHRWIVRKFDHHVHNPIPSILTVGNFDILSYEKYPSHCSIFLSRRNPELSR